MSILVIPVDASQIPDSDRKQQRVKVAVQSPGGVHSQIVSLEAGKAEVKLDVDPKQPVSIAIGPDTASDEDIFHLQTLTQTVSPAQWKNQPSLTIPSIAVTPQWWKIWLGWCREFVIEGRVLCASGPVPGAEVQAFDVDFFWWWSSISQVGPTAITGPDGHFTIKFRWCCGWLPIWWWNMRFWRLDPVLVQKIQPVLKLNPALKFPAPSPVVSLNIAGLATPPIPKPPVPLPVQPILPKPTIGTVGTAASRVLDPSTIPALRTNLVAALPHVAELEKLRIWPWIPWTPWFDCTPDIIFRVTQHCGGNDNRVIVNENVFQTRFDIPTHLNVTLVANDQACCLPSNPGDPHGDCAVITGVCGDPGIIAAEIGGNSAHPGGPSGYEDPGNRDRPFSEVVNISGLIGVSPQSAYYTIEYRHHLDPPALNPAPFVPVPGAALQGFTRGYFDSTQPWPNEWFYPPFPVQTFGTTKSVYESRHHYEETHLPNNWGNVAAGRSWFLNVNMLASIQTSGIFADGKYEFRVRGFKALANGNLDPLDPGVVLPGCGNHQDNNLLVLALDNRFSNGVQPGNVHVDTTEPDCGITNVLIGGTTVPPCGAQHVLAGVPLEIDFFATDPDGHLDHYELNVLWGLGNIRNLLTVPGHTLTNLSAAPNNQAGPDYADAIGQGATRPIWRGGNMRLVIPNAADVFPVTCCYLVELTVWKRNIVSCDGHLSYYNQMHYSFTVTV